MCSPPAYDEVEQIEIKPSASSKTPKQQKVSKKTTANIDKTKPIRRPPSLGATLRAFRSRIEAMSLQIEFEKALFAELESLELDQTAKQPHKRRKTKL